MNGIEPTVWFRFILAQALWHRTVTAMALSPHNLRLRDNEKSRNFSGERPLDRTLFLLLSLLIVIVLSLMLGSRFNRLRHSAIVKRNITSALVLILYVLVICFTVSLVVLHTGQGLYNYHQCFSATWVCLVLYASSKSVIYVFLVERVHVVRAPYVGRSQDRIYIGCTLFMIAAFTGVVINAWIHPYTKMYASDGRCHMGIIKKVTIPFLLIDILMDIVLTGVFVYLLRPTIKDNGLSNFPSIFNTKRPCETSPTPPTHRESRKTTVQRSIRKLLRKSIIGALLITVPTVALFFVQYYVVEGKGPAFVCSTICLVDVFWGYIVVHWLTFGSLEAEKDLVRSTQASQKTLKSARPCVTCNAPSRRGSAVVTTTELTSLPTLSTLREFSFELLRKELSDEGLQAKST